MITSSTVRKKSFSSLLEVEAIIPETDGTLSVLKNSGSHQQFYYQELLDKKESVS